jgi:hypothetical protein
MSPKTGARLQELIDELGAALPAHRGSDAIERRLRQAMALLHATADTLEEIAALAADRRAPRPALAR